jgi:DNA-binding beta-propeller fold protein YncE
LIRKITLTGNVSTIAGSAGVAGTSDGIGSAARFNSPRGIAVDSSGNIYVSDTNNHIIRKMGSNGTVSKFAGFPSVIGTTDGLGQFASFKNPLGIHLDSSGYLYVAYSGNRLIRRITPDGSVTTAFVITTPQYATVDSFGNLFFTSGFKIQTASRCIYSAFGNKTCLQSGFLGIARSIESGNPIQCTNLTVETNTTCCYISN